jgi:hypothetical protein
VPELIGHWACWWAVAVRHHLDNRPINKEAVWVLVVVAHSEKRDGSFF